jgi:hypothetical protein
MVDVGHLWAEYGYQPSTDEGLAVPNPEFPDSFLTVRTDRPSPDCRTHTALTL